MFDSKPQDANAFQSTVPLHHQVCKRLQLACFRFPPIFGGAMRLLTPLLRLLSLLACLGVFTAPAIAADAGNGDASSSQYLISTFAGNGTYGFSGDGVSAVSTRLANPAGVTFDSAGNLYISDQDNNRIRKVSASTGLIATVAGSGSPGYPGAGDGGLATSAGLFKPDGIALDSAGNLYIAESSNGSRIRKVAASTGIITTIAGGGSILGDNEPASSALLVAPYGLAVDSAGNLYIADSGNRRIRKINAATGIITTVAGNGTQGFSGDGGSATSASLNYPQGVALDSTGNLYIVDAGNYRIRKVAAGTGIITTVAGNGSSVFSGDGGAATAAGIGLSTNGYLKGVVLDSAGNLYFSDNLNGRVRKVTASSGVISTVAGGGSSLGDGGSATSASLKYPSGIVIDSAGNLYVADAGNYRIRKLASISSYVLTVSLSGNGTGTVSSSPAGIDCGADCSESYPGGTIVTLMATPASGSSFAGWSGACSGASSCTVTMDAVKTVAAAFSINATTVSKLVLNDTGIAFCGDGNSNTATCAGVAVDSGAYPRQDARYGRDAAAAAGKLPKTGGGEGGFDFTALNASGQPTAPTSGATPHPCVRDNVTGLVWEVKTADGGLRDQRWIYSWFDSVHNYSGNPGRVSSGWCKTDGRCDTEKYVADVNATALCGFTDWRLPNHKELQDIVQLGRTNPAIDSAYFPNTQSSGFWSGSPTAAYTDSAWVVFFRDGVVSVGSRSNSYPVRLARGG